MQSAPIHTRLNAALAGAMVLINLYQFILLPMFFHPAHPSWLVTLLLCAVLSNSFWFLIHEAIHRNLLPDARLNDGAGRVLSVLFGSPYFIVRFGHLMHHRFNGSEPDRPDLYESAKISRANAVITYYWELCVGLYVSEVLVIFLFFLPKHILRGAIERLLSGHDAASKEVRSAAVRQLLAEKTLRAIRIDGAAVCALLAASFTLYGAFWYVVIAVLLVRGFFISFANNLPHYGTDPGDVKFALNIGMPKLLGLFYLNFNYHRTHHRDPLVPWTLLPQAFLRSGESLDTSIRTAALAQFKGPIPRERFPFHTE